MLVYVIVKAFPNGNEAVVKEVKTEKAAQAAVARHKGPGRTYYFPLTR